ncbi:MAG TPA: M3 family oligoendopeptidase [Ktedonobacteraceae bacterium]|nr:M3 family oligoendopeptidase [Ktedonobacteraceae bacterium]
MYSPLPQSSATFEQLSWAEIEPWYRELAATNLTPESLEPWLRQWSQLSALANEANTWLVIATTRSTADKAISQRRQRFLDEILTHVQHVDQQVRQQLLASGLELPGFAIPLGKLRVDAHLFNTANVVLLNEEKKLGVEYIRINGAQKVTWEGKEIPLRLLNPQMLDPDRKRREQAWRAFHERKLADREALYEVWAKALQIRQQIARNAGYDTYREYRWQQLYRFDYTPADCKALHDAVEQVIMPVASQLAEKRRKLLGVETLRPWDITVDPRASSAPRAIEDHNTLLRTVARMFSQIDPAFGGYFDTMINGQYFDLEARAEKAPGGYNLALEVKHVPFIFGHVMTIRDAVKLLFHEAGHAFHTFEMRKLPFLYQRNESMLPMEFAEVASKSMELIGNTHLVSSGLCAPEEARLLRLQHLEGLLLSLPTLVRGDAFQHWVYEHPEQAASPEMVGRTWAELSRRFQPDLDWSGLEAMNENSWQSILHFFTHPFYYIEYAFATIGALQVWRNYLHDPQRTIQHYRHALALGATRSLPELYQVAGATFVFNKDTLRDTIQLVMGKIEELEQEA